MSTKCLRTLSNSCVSSEYSGTWNAWHDLCCTKMFRFFSDTLQNTGTLTTSSYTVVPIYCMTCGISMLLTFNGNPTAFILWWTILYRLDKQMSQRVHGQHSESSLPLSQTESAEVELEAEAVHHWLFRNQDFQTSRDQSTCHILTITRGSIECTWQYNIDAP